MKKAQGEAIVGTILAGGQSRRMGGSDKCLLELAGKPLLAHVIERLEPQVSGMVLNANGDASRFDRFGMQVIADPVQGFAGPLAGVLAGMTWAGVNDPAARWVVTAASDTPFFPRDLVARLLAATGGEYPAISMAASGGRTHPVFGLWPTALRNDLEAALKGGTRKVLDWTDGHPNFTAEFEPTTIGGASVDPFFNANRPDDLAQAEGLMSQEVDGS